MEASNEPQSTKTTCFVDEFRIDTVRSALERLARRAQKLSLPPLEYEVGAPTERPLPRQKPGAKQALGIFFPVTLEHRVVRLSGWRFIAALDNIDGQVLTRAVPGVELGASVRGLTPDYCDHCRTRRRRNATFLVEHEDGRRKQVGRTCLADFLGQPDAVNIALYAELMLDALATLEDQSAGSGGATEYLQVERFLAFVAKVVREVGWRSRAQAEFSGQATADTALLLYTAKAHADDIERPTEEDRVLASTTKAWVVDTFKDRELSDYEYNLAVAMNAEVLGFRHAGIAASAVAAYLRHFGELHLAGAPRRIDDYFGVVGKRQTFRAFLVDVSPFDNDYGTSYRHRFVTESGHYLCWWTSAGSLHRDLDKLRTFKATVKAHDTDKRGIRETKLSRVVEVEEPKAPSTMPSTALADEAAHA